MPRPLAALALALAVALSGQAAAAEPRVAVSIKPVHSLVAGVMEGVGRPALIVPAGASPHTYTLKPSDAKALSRATLVFWIGEGLEAFLAKPLEALAGEARVVALAEAPGIRLLPARRGGTWPAESHRPEGPGGSGGHTRHGPNDMHLWMDPANARAIVAVVVAQLSALDPAHAAIYRSNGGAVRKRLEALEREMRARLAPVANVPYVVFHDAFQYLEKAFGLRALGSVTVSPERPPGARRIAEIRAAIRRLGARCLFREPQFASPLVATIARGLDLKLGVLDPLGSAFPDGPELYFRMMRANAGSLVSCLGAG